MFLIFKNFEVIQMKNKLSTQILNVENYEKGLTKETKRKFGRYNTPIDLVKFMLNDIKLNTTMKILEPGCGVGNFVVMILEELKEKYASQNNIDNNITRIILENNLFALDNDSHAIDILKHFLDVSKYENNIKVCSFLTQTVFDNEKFDLIIGNPPYAATLSDEEKKYCQKNFPDIFDETNDSAALFTAKSIELLKEGGYLSFIVPATILRVLKYRSLREKIKKSCDVIRIVDVRRAFKDVGYEVVILVLRKKNGFEKPKEVEVLTDFNLNNLSYKKHTLNYDYFENRLIFPLFISNSLVPVINNIEEDTILLSKIAAMPRGLAIVSTDNRYISYSKKQGYIEALRGKDIERFRTKPIKIYIEILQKNIKKYYDFSKQKKILVQNLAYKIVAALDESGAVPLDTLNTLLIKKNDFYYEYIICILNSQLMSFYFQNAITNRARLNIHLDEPYLGQIPIKIIDKTKQQEFVNLFNQLNKKFDKKIIELIDEEVFKLYGITNKKEIVENTING